MKSETREKRKGNERLRRLRVGVGVDVCNVQHTHTTYLHTVHSHSPYYLCAHIHIYIDSHTLTDMGTHIFKQHVCNLLQLQITVPG